MGNVSKATLKSYFQVGNIPSENNFSNLIDSCHSGRPPITISDNDASYDLSSDTCGGVFIQAEGCGLVSGKKIQLPEATVANVGLHYRVLFAASQSNLKIGPISGTTKLTGSVTVMTSIGGVGGNSVNVSPPATSTFLSCSATVAAHGGSSGSVLDFYYHSSSAVFVTGKLTCDVSNPTATSLYGTGDLVGL